VVGSSDSGGRTLILSKEEGRRDQGLSSRVSSSVFWDSGLRDQGSRFRGSGGRPRFCLKKQSLRGSSPGFEVSGSLFQVLGFGLGISGSRIRFQGFGHRVSGVEHTPLCCLKKIPFCPQDQKNPFCPHPTARERWSTISSYEVVKLCTRI
jgi:hypothetical protein